MKLYLKSQVKNITSGLL